MDANLPLYCYAAVAIVLSMCLGICTGDGAVREAAGAAARGEPQFVLTARICAFGAGCLLFALHLVF